jgi:hypothetical protein
MNRVAYVVNRNKLLEGQPRRQRCEALRARVAAGRDYQSCNL